MNKNKIKKLTREALIIIISVVAIVSVVSWVQAGNLTPLSSPGSTMHTVQEIFDPLASTSYDSSGVVADPNGNAHQIVKCIIHKINSIPCP